MTQNDLRPLDILEEMAHGMNSATRTIYVGDEIDLYTPTFIEDRINKICQMSNNNQDPINLVISSYGGDVYGMYGAIDVIQGSKLKINTLGRGAVMSAGVGILVAGTGIRRITKRTHVMIHQISTWGTGGNVENITADATQGLTIQKELFEYLESKSNKNAKYWKKVTAKANFYLTAADALSHGLVDEIV